MPRPPKSEAQLAASRASAAALTPKRMEKRMQTATAANAPLTGEIVGIPTLDTPAPQLDGGPARNAIATPREASPVEETITVPVSALDALIEQKLQAALAARLAGTPQGVLPATPTTPAKPVWVFLHADSPGFATLLPRHLQHLTPDGYVRFRPEGATKNRLRPKRGKYPTDNPEIAAWLTERIEAGKLPQVVADTDKNRLKLLEQEVAQAAA